VVRLHYRVERATDEPQATKKKSKRL